MFQLHTQLKARRLRPFYFIRPPIGVLGRPNMDRGKELLRKIILDEPPLPKLLNPRHNSIKFNIIQYN